MSSQGGAPSETHTAAPEGLSVFPLLYSSEFYSFFVWEFSDCLMIFQPLPPLHRDQMYIIAVFEPLDLAVLLLNIWHNLFFMHRVPLLPSSPR